MRFFSTSFFVVVALQFSLLSLLIIASPVSTSKGASDVEPVRSNVVLNKVVMMPRPNVTELNFAEVGPVRSQGYYCYGSGSTINLDAATNGIANCCGIMSNTFIPPNNFAYVEVRTSQHNTVLLCQFGTSNDGWLVSYGDCSYAMTTIMSKCWNRNNGKVTSRGGEGYIPFGNTGLDARLDPNSG